MPREFGFQGRSNSRYQNGTIKQNSVLRKGENEDKKFGKKLVHISPKTKHNDWGETKRKTSQRKKERPVRRSPRCKGVPCPVSIESGVTSPFGTRPLIARKAKPSVVCSVCLGSSSCLLSDSRTVFGGGKGGGAYRKERKGGPGPKVRTM